MRPDDICPRPAPLPNSPTRPHSPPLHMSSVWECDSPAQADALLGGQSEGYVYQRDRHPNADQLAASLTALHGAERGVVTGSGMGALAGALLAFAKSGDEVVVGNRVYGKTLQLLRGEGSRLGIGVQVVDAQDPAAVAGALTERTRLVVVETIANPLLQVADLKQLADVVHRHANCRLLVDNTFASPILCRPLGLGADLVMESLTKTLNGHSDVVLGFLAGRASDWSRVPTVVATWGLAAPPFESWLALRGLATAHLRIERACDNALAAAKLLSQHRSIDRVDYPGLDNHPDHALAAKQFGGRFGAMVSFRLRGGRPAADAFITAAKQIPFCPSLGGLCTMLSHPETTSHRGLTQQEREALEITGGTIRLSVGTESDEFVCQSLTNALDATCI